MAKRAIAHDQLERKVYKRLRAAIVSGELPSGQQLTEARIADELGVSKTPVREALIRLQSEGLVEIIPYRGARVHTPSVAEIREVLELRLCIEEYIARRCAEERPESIIAQLERSIEIALRAFKEQDQKLLIFEIRKFSRILSHSCGNTRMVSILDGLRSVLDLIGTASRRTEGRLERSITEHAAILEAIRSGDPKAAAAATAAHIQSLQQDTLEALERDVGSAPSATTDGKASLASSQGHYA